MDIKLKAILAESARSHVRIERGGQGGNYTFPKLGLTAVSIDQGQISSLIPWMIHGIEAEISGDIVDFVSSFELQAFGLVSCEVGHYVLRNRSNQILAEARVQECGSDKRSCYVHGKRREDVVKLYEMIRDGETALESVGGRRGLISDLRSTIASQAGDLVDYQNRFQATFDLCARTAQLLGEVSKERDDLKDQIADLKKPRLSLWNSLLRKVFEVDCRLLSAK